MSLDQAGLDQAVARAQEGDRGALEEVVDAIRDDVYRLALRFLWHPQDAEDAAQEILVRVVTRLSSFAQRSSFSTWVYRVACNRLLTVRRRRAEARAMTPAEFAEDLATIARQPTCSTSRPPPTASVCPAPPSMT